MTPYFKEQLGCEGSMSQHDTLTRALQEIADWNSHTTEFAVDYGSNGVRDFYRGIARAALSATQPAQAAQSDWSTQRFNAPVYPPDGTESPFTVINLGSGKVQMGDSIHDGRLPALWFGINGQGMGHEETMNREARPGETLAVVTFANVEGLDVLLDVIQRIRREKFPEAQAAQAAQSVPGVNKAVQLIPGMTKEQFAYVHHCALEVDAAKAETARLLAENAALKAQAAQPVSRDVIRDVFLRNGFTIKDGCSDLKPYVYAAANALLEVAAAQPVQGAGEVENVPLAWQATRDGLLAYVLQDDLHNRLTPRVIDIAYTAFMYGARGRNAEDGSQCDWFNDTKPAIEKAITKLRKDLFEASNAPTQPAAGADVLDAGRYRWLRTALADRSNQGKSHWFCSIPEGAPSELDSAIDAAIAASGRQE